MTTRLEDVGIRDVAQKHVVVCRQLGGGGPQFTLLWRTKGKRGKPLPAVGDYLELRGFGRVRVERIDAPGSMDLDVHGSTLVIKA